jgi:hypothetical protein
VEGGETTSCRIVTLKFQSPLSRAATTTCINPLTLHLGSKHNMTESRKVTTVVPLLKNGIDASPSGQNDAPVLSCSLPPNSDAAKKAKKAVYNDGPWHPMYEGHFPHNHPYVGSRYGRFDTPLQPSHSRQIHVQCRTDNENLAKRQILSFLDLPTELRLLVYQHLSVQRQYHKISIPYTYKPLEKSHEGRTKFIIIIRSVPGISILATCKPINEEAGPILVPLRKQITSKPPQILMDIACAAETAALPANPIPALIGYCASLERHPLMTYEEFLRRAYTAYTEILHGRKKTQNNWRYNLKTDGVMDGYYEDYPFHLYSWLYEQPAFRNWVTKAARQMLHCRSSRHIEIGIFSKASIHKTRAQMLAGYLYKAIQRWFGGISAHINLRVIEHLCSSDIRGAIHRGWPIRTTSKLEVIAFGSSVSKRRWKNEWIEKTYKPYKPPGSLSN